MIRHSRPAPRRALVLLGAKGADNAQMLTLAAALPVEVQELRLEFNVARHLPNWLLPNCPANLTRDCRAALAAVEPPDVVLAVGKRSYRAASAIKARSGGRTRWIHIGRPWGALAPIDLVITTPQYALAADTNVLMLPAPIATLTRPQTDAPLAPLMVVLVGGNSSSHRLDAARARVLLARARARAEALGAEVLFLTSRRTPPAVAAVLAAARGPRVAVQLWNAPDADYAGALARASAFIVTSDSASMLTEAVLSGRPVQVFASEERPLRRLIAALGRLWCGVVGADHAARVSAWLARHGWVVPPRDMTALVRALHPHGVRDLEQDEPPPPASPPLDTLGPARTAVLRVLDRS